MENFPGSSGKTGPVLGGNGYVHPLVHRKDEIRLSATEPEEIGRWA